MNKVCGLGLVFALCLHLPTAATPSQLDQNQIIDIKLLNGLSNLTSLYLDRNQIVDIQPLAKLRNLT